MRRLLLAAALLWSGPAEARSVDCWSGLIAEASARFSLPAGWIRRVLEMESGGRTSIGGKPIVSSAGAMGPMQLMPGTWRDMRDYLGLGTDPFDPHDNLLAGAAYLRLMYDRFGYPGLFAAYNAGPARFAASLDGRHRLPAETRAYLAAVAPPAKLRSAASGRPSPLFAFPGPGLPPPALARLAPGRSLFAALPGTESGPLEQGEAAGEEASR